MDIDRLKQSLGDAGCSSDDIGRIVRMFAEDEPDMALRAIRKNRCTLMAQLHESGRKIDCLDFLIRDLEKEIRQTK
ncbi:MAG: hypothetical protein IJ251_00890 [Oscillospiraceae bacterium]|nr:hypothetical protein [Oscillospiraceae bacterium]